MSSGVSVADECKKEYESIKSGKKHRYLIYVIEKEKEIQIETIGKRDATYEDFIRDLSSAEKGDSGKGECRYGVFDYEYQHQCQGTASGSFKQKLILVSWCPDTAKIKPKMLYSSSFDALKKSLVGIAKIIQGTDLDEVSREIVEEKLRSGDRF